MHAEAPSTDQTDWPQILALYDLLVAFTPGPMTSLNRIVAVAMVHGERTALGELEDCAATPEMAGHHRVHSVRGHLLERLGRDGRGGRAVPPRRPGHPQRSRAALPDDPGAGVDRVARQPGRVAQPVGSGRRPRVAAAQA